MSQGQQPEDEQPESPSGTVWIAWSGDDARPRWIGYWDAEPDAAPRVLENGPGWESPSLAVAWGRARTERVFIRVSDDGPYLWAGPGDPPEDSEVHGVFIDEQM